MVRSKESTEPNPQQKSVKTGRHPLPCLFVYAAIFVALYWLLAKQFVTPYLLIGLEGQTLTFGDSATPCVLGFSVAMVAGCWWPIHGRLIPSVIAAVLAPVCAAGFCVLGYSLLAGLLVGLIIAALGIAVFLFARLVLRADWINSAGAALSTAMLASLLCFAGLASGFLSVKTLPDNEATEYWKQVQAIMLDEMDALGIEDMNVRVGPLPKREIARYSHSTGTITVSASAVLGTTVKTDSTTVPDPVSAEELAEGVLHTLAHCSQASSSEALGLWSEIARSDVESWLAVTDGACPPKDERGEFESPAFEQIELAAEDYAKERLAHVAISLVKEEG